MSNPSNSPNRSPKGPEGVPVDAPDNDAPALSPHAVSRMHRAEDDAKAIAGSPDHSDARSLSKDADERREQEQWTPGAPGSGARDDASRGLDADNGKHVDPNPSHHTTKRDSEPPRGAGDGELMEQPESANEARQQGPEKE